MDTLTEQIRQKRKQQKNTPGRTGRKHQPAKELARLRLRRQLNAILAA